MGDIIIDSPFVDSAHHLCVAWHGHRLLSACQSSRLEISLPAHALCKKLIQSSADWASTVNCWQQQKKLRKWHALNLALRALPVNYTNQWEFEWHLALNGLSQLLPWKELWLREGSSGDWTWPADLQLYRKTELVPFGAHDLEPQYILVILTLRQ